MLHQCENLEGSAVSPLLCTSLKESVEGNCIYLDLALLTLLPHTLH